MEKKNLHSIAVIALTAAAFALAIPGNAQGRRPGGGGPGGGRPSSSQSSSPRSSSSSMSSSPRSSSPSMSSSPRSSAPRSSSPSMSSSPRSSSHSISSSSPRSSSPSMDRSFNRPSSNNSRTISPSGDRPSSNFNNRPSGNGNFHGGGNPGGGRPSGNRPSTGGSTNFGRDNARAGVGSPTMSGNVRNTTPSSQFNRGDIRPGGNDRPGGNGRPGGNDRPGGNNGGQPGGNHGGNYNGGNHGGGQPGGNHGGNYGRPGGNNRPGGNHGGNYGRPGGNDRPGGNMGHRPPAGRPHHGINHGGPRPNYDHYRWHSSFRPRGPRDRWYDYYRYNRWSWYHPIAPPLRPWRPRVIWYYRPVIPVGYRIYASAPIITGVLGLEFGTLLDASLNFLYYNGYSIDGYQDNVVYLRDVNMMGYSWPDVMLQYDNGGGLCYAEFVTSSTYQDDYRFNNLYSNLCSTYGTPINSGNGYYSWYGGNQTGYINLNFAYDNGRYYTVMTLGT